MKTYKSLCWWVPIALRIIMFDITSFKFNIMTLKRVISSFSLTYVSQENKNTLVNSANSDQKINFWLTDLGPHWLQEGLLITALNEELKHPAS